MQQGDDGDRRLRGLFREQRGEEERRAPAFEHVLQAALERRGRPAPRVMSRWRPVFAAAAAIALVLALLLPARLHRPAPDYTAWEKLSSWSAPTEGFLSVSTTTWGSTVSTPTDDWIGDSPENETTTAKEKERS